MIRTITFEQNPTSVVVIVQTDNGEPERCWQVDRSEGSMYPSNGIFAWQVVRWVTKQIDKATDYMTPMGVEKNIEDAIFRGKAVAMRIDSTQPVWDRLHYVA